MTRTDVYAASISPTSPDLLNGDNRAGRPGVRRQAMLDYLGKGDWMTQERRLLAFVAVAGWSLTAAVRPWESRKAARFAASRGPHNLHIGCGAQYKPGWINVDYAHPLWLKKLSRPLTHRLGWTDPTSAGPAPAPDLSWDLSRPLPFPPDSVDAIFAEHVLEHLTYAAGTRLVRSCHSVLRPGGVLRLGVPDLERYIHGYLGIDPVLDECRPGRPTRAVALSEVFYHHGHRAGYDGETLQLICVEAGFASTDRLPFGEGRIGAMCDSESRRADTVYVEAVK